jgi:thiol-disulfide isomerase/thioredoxin
VPPEDVVALINGRMVTAETVELVQAVDEAMAELLARPAEPAETLLDRVVNLALTAQIADEAGFELPADTASQFREAMLAENGRSAAELSDALAQRNVTLAQFDAYLGQLLRTDQFLRQEAEAQGITSGAVLAQLQAQARISLGPVAARIIPTPTPLPPTPDPVAEPTAASTETPIPVQVIRTRGTGTGQLLPSFALPLAGDAETVVDADSLIGQPTVLSFFTTWCPYCKRQTPILVEAFDRSVAAGVAIQFVGIDVKEPVGLALSYAQENGIVYPILLDESGSTAATYGVPGYPTTFFLDDQGQIVDRHIGALTEELLAGYLARIGAQ